MPFDASTAKPVADEDQSSGFDLSTAKPVGKVETVPNPVEDKHSSEEYEAPGDKNLSPEAARLEKLARKASKNKESLLKGVGESALSFGTGLASSAAGGIAGLGRAAYSLASGEGLDKAAEKGTETIQKVQKAGTYQPRSATGQAINQAAGTLASVPGKVGSEVGGAVGQAIGGEQGRIAGESIGEAAPSLIPTAQGLRGALKAGAKELPSKTMTRRQQVASQSQDLGYTIPPAQARPTLLNKILEGASGKIKTGQGASELNQPITQKIVKDDFGIPESAELNHESVKAVRDKAGTAYQDLSNYDKDFVATTEYQKAIDNLGGTTERIAKKFPNLVSSDQLETLKKSLKVDEMAPVEAVELSKLLREKASDLLSPTASGESKALGRSYRAANDALEKMIEQNLEQSGNTALLNKFRDARQTIAKTYSVEKAMDAAGNVDANKLAAQLQRGKPLSGGTKKVAEFASEFGKAAKTPNQVGSHLPVDALDFLAAMAAGLGTGNVAGVGTVLARPAIRAGILSKAYQKGPASAAKGVLDTSGRLGYISQQASPAAAGQALKPEDEQQ